MLKIKDNINLKELKKYGFIYEYDFFKNYNGKDKPVHWWNDGRDLDQYRYYRLGSEKYDINLIIYENDEKRKINCYAPFSEYGVEDTETCLNVLFDLIQAGLVEKV